MDFKVILVLGAGSVLAASAAQAQTRTESSTAKADVRQMVTDELAAHIGHETVIMRLWSYRERDGGLTFCGVALDQGAPAREGRDRSNFVFSTSPNHERFFLWRTTTEVMGAQGCGRLSERTDIMHPDLNGPLGDLTIYEPPRSPAQPLDTSHIPKDAYGNILVTEADKANPRCAAGTEYAYRIFVRHERNVIEGSGEPAANFNDYTQPFGRCFNRMGQAIMQGVLERAQTASDRLWLQNELRSLRLRRP